MLSDIDLDVCMLAIEMQIRSLQGEYLLALVMLTKDANIHILATEIHIPSQRM